MADDESDDLTPEQTDKLLQFQDLTGIEEIRSCRETLEQHNWDLEVAVQDTFNEREGAPSVFAQPQAEPRTPPMNLQPTDQRIYTVARRRPQGVVQWSYYVILFPFRFVYSTIVDILKFAYRLIRPDPRRNVTDPIGDVTRFIDRYHETYGVSHPVFYQGSYSQALNDAKRELRFLLVYLHGDDHQDTDVFCRATLCDPDIIDFVNSHMLFWACSTNSPEGYRVSQALRETTYPFLAVIVLRENRMTVVARIEGPIENADLMTRLSQVMESNETSLIAARADREERNFNQSLRQEQDEAYEISLRADREKERKRQEKLEEVQRQRQLVQDELFEQERLLEEREHSKSLLREDIPPEPAADDPDAIRILFKLPSGCRLERRFIKTQSIKLLYYFVFCHDQCPDDFQIIANFPRRTLPCQPTEECPEPPSFESIGLGKSEMLFIHDNDA